MKRIVVIVLLAAVAIVAAISVYFILTIKPEKYQPLIERTLSEKVGRSVSLGKIDFSILGGFAFEVSDLKVAGDDVYPEEYPLQFGFGKFKMKILPLFLGNVRIKEVIVDSPALFLRKYRDGHLSIEDVLENLERRGEREEVEEGKEKKPLDLEIETVRVTQGSYTFIAELPDKRLEKTTVSPVDAKISNIGYDREVKTALSVIFVEPLAGEIDISGNLKAFSSAKRAGDVSFTFSGRVFDVPAKIEGGVTLAGRIPEFEGMITSENLEFEKITEIYTEITGKELPVRSGGKGRFMLAAGGTPDEFGFEGEMDLTRATLFYQDNVEKYADTELNLIFQGRYLKRLVIISNAEFRMPHLLSSINGRYNIESGRYELKSSFEVAKLESVSQFFKDLSQLNLSGGVVTSASARGKDKILETLSVQTDLKEVSVDLSKERLNVRSLSGHLEMNRDGFSLNPLTGLLNGQRISLSGKLTMTNGPRGDFTAKANYLDLDSILEVMGKEGEKEKEGAAKQEPVPERVKKADVRVNVTVDTLKYKEVKVNNVGGALRLKNGEVTWDGIEVGLFDGKVETDGSYSMFSKDKHFQLRLDSKNVSLFDFMKNVTSFGGFMDGTADLKLTLTGDAAGVANFRKTLSGKGEIKIKSGKIEGVDLLSDIGGAAGIKGLLEQYTGKSKFKRSVTVFDDIQAPFEIHAGEAVVKNFLLTAADFQLKGEARYTADNRFVFSGDAVFPKAIAGNAGDIGKFITDDKGNLIVPLNIAGPLNGPRVTFDPQGLLKKKKEKIKEEEMEKIEKKLLDAIKEKKLF
jgi:uncharacterized protein involved in outer membrane biogenesis